MAPARSGRQTELVGRHRHADRGGPGPRGGWPRLRSAARNV